MEYIVSMKIIIDSIVSVNRSYENRNGQTTDGRWYTHLPTHSMTLIPHRAGLLVGYKANERLSVGFCERVVYPLNISARANFLTGAR
jgi:hypothetical protein